MDVRYLPDTLLQPCCLRTENKIEQEEKKEKKTTWLATGDNRGRKRWDFLFCLVEKKTFIAEKLLSKYL